MKRKLILILAVGFSSLFLSPLLAEGRALGLVVYKKGNAYLLHKKRSKKIKRDMLIGAGDTIKTGRRSYVSIQFRSGLIFRIGPHSRVTVERLARKSVALNINRGRIAGRVAKGRGYQVRVTAPTTIAGVRGTDFIVEVNEDKKSTKVMVKTGIVDVTDEKGENNTAVEAGYKVISTTKGIQRSILEAYEKQKFNIFKEFNRVKKVNIEALIKQKQRDQELLKKHKKLFR